MELGRLGAPFGLKGWVHVQSHTDPPRRLLEYREWVLRLTSGERLTRRVTEGRAHADGLVALLEGVADRDEAAALEGAELGTVSHFVDMPHGAVMVTQAPDGREHWVLAVPRHLRKVDLAARTIL